MEQTSSKWLKDELGLIHMSEADLYGLAFHPRYGNLCRRLLKFFENSTLCGIKFPNVYVREELDKAESELRQKREQLQQLDYELETCLRDDENLDLESNYLKSRLEYLRNIEDVQKTLSEALEAMANRPNLGIEQVNSMIDDNEYLTQVDLINLYNQNNLSKLDESVSARHLSSLDDELNELVMNIDTMHNATTKLLSSINKNIDSTQCDIQPRNIAVEDLVALKVPEYEEIVVDVDQEGREMKEKHLQLHQEVCDLNEQVSQIINHSKVFKVGLIKSFKDQSSDIICYMKELHNFESRFKKIIAKDLVDK